MLYSRPYGISDFFTDECIDHSKVVAAEREMINFMQLSASSISQINDYALTLGINPEEVSRRRDEAKRMEKMIQVEIEERIEADNNFDAIAYMKQRAEELGLNEERLDNLLSKAGWRGYRNVDDSQ